MPTEAAKEHFAKWSLYWAAGVIFLIGVILAAWGIWLAIDTVYTAQAIKGPSILKKIDAAKPPVANPQKRAANLILPYAKVDAVGLTLYLPAEYKHFRGMGYHESSHTRAFSMTPIGHLLKNDNGWDIDVPLTSAAPLPTYNIMESRGQYAYGTTVADIALDPGTSILAPVSGTVTKVEQKIIYDEYGDMQIEMTPDGFPNVTVAFLHVDKIRIKPGDHLRQGLDAIGIPKDWRASFASELDDYVKPAMPHVHIQVNTPEQP